MRTNVIDISTEVFHLLKDRTPGFVAWLEEKPGPTQKILLEDAVYSVLIDRAIAQRQTLDEVFRAICTGTQEAMFLDHSHDCNARRVQGN